MPYRSTALTEDRSILDISCKLAVDLLSLFVNGPEFFQGGLHRVGPLRALHFTCEDGFICRFTPICQGFDEKARDGCRVSYVILFRCPALDRTEQDSQHL